MTSAHDSPHRPNVEERSVAVVLAAHGELRGAEPNATLTAHRDALAALGIYHSVHTGVLKGDPSIEDAILAAHAAGATCVIVYPVFMADGYFTRKVLAGRVEALALGDRCRILPPLGLDERLPGLMCEEAASAARQRGIDPRGTRLIVAGHGSKIGPASADATRRAATAIGRANTFRSVAVAFLEEPEFLNDALAATEGFTVVSGFFSGEGLHGGEDVPAAIAQSGADAVYAGSIGASAKIRDLVRSSVGTHLRRLRPIATRQT